MTATTADATDVLLIQPTQLAREGMSRIVQECGYTVQSSAAALDEALAQPEATGRTSPDFVIIDAAALEDDPCPELTRLRETFPTVRIVVLIDAEETRKALLSFMAGADSCLMKNMSTSALQNCLRLAALGERVVPSQMLASLLRQPALSHLLDPQDPETGDLASPESSDLSARELDILAALAAGNANKQIARETGVSESTVKVHLRNILRKLGASNRTQAAIWAIRHGITGKRSAA
jgi:two-component system nitrate/nitrite response regulator NarL